MLPEERCVLSYIFYHRHDAQGLRFRKDKKQAYRYPYSERSGVLSVIHSAENLCRQSVFCCRNIYIRAFGFGFLRLVLLFGENAEIHKESADDERKIFSPVLSAQRVLITGLRWLIVTKAHITAPALIVLIMFAVSYVVSYLVSKYILDSNNFFRFLCGLKVQKNK